MYFYKLTRLTIPSKMDYLKCSQADLLNKN